VSDHFSALKQHLHGNLFDFVLANTNYNGGLPQEWHSEPVRIDKIDLEGARVVKSDVVAVENRYRHDSKKLADALIRLYYERHQMVDAEPLFETVEVEPQKAVVG
jgi:hypothetical protein